MKYHFYVLIILIIGTSSSCSSPQKLYEKGKYFKAFDSVLGDLKEGKKDRKDVVLLNKSFSKMIDMAKDEMYLLNDGYKVNDLSHNFKQYHEVDKRYTKGRTYLDDENDVKYERFSADKKQLVNDAYEEGKALMVYFEESKNKSDARNAYYHFELVKEHGNGYNDIKQLLFDAKRSAIVIYNVDADLDSDFTYQWDVDRKFDDLEGESGFVRIVYDNHFVTSDCFVQLDFSRLDIDESNDESYKNYSKKILEGYKTETDTSGNTTQIPIYNEVSGSVTTKAIKKTVAWRVDLEIINSSQNCKLREDRFRASVEDRVEIFELSGDERAIPDEFKNNSNNRLEDTDDMVEELIDELYRQIRNYLY